MSADWPIIHLLTAFAITANGAGPYCKDNGRSYWSISACCHGAQLPHIYRTAVVPDCASIHATLWELSQGK